jgi:Flp pilus assembly pilin Flp
MTRGAEILVAARALLVDCEGSSLAEYALLAAALGLAMIAGTAAIQTNAGAFLNANDAGWQATAVAVP